MEAEWRRGSGSSAKMSKKGGKHVKLTAEEAAKRREEVKEQLRERMELERRALNVVERLLEDSVAADFLVDCAKFITPANYKDTVEERSISKLCGYPICSNKLGKIPTQQFKISTKTNRVYDITERKMFCSNFCYKSSKEFELQISQTPLWFRKHESPPEIKLLKKGDGGSSGEEVKLSERRLKEEDIENPLASPPEGRRLAGTGDSSDGEQEPDFVSSVVSQERTPRVHWGDLPKHTDEDSKRMRMRREVIMKDNQEETEPQQSQTKEKGQEIRKENVDEAAPEEDSGVEDATAKINTCRLSGDVVHSDDPPERSPTRTEAKPSQTSPPVAETKPARGSNIGSPSAPTVGSQERKVSSEQPSMSITQVGVSRKGAAGLRALLKDHAAEPKPDTVRLRLLEGLKTTFQEWCTSKTVTFLHGVHGSLASSVPDVRDEMKAEEEELDEDDLQDGVALADAEETRRCSDAAPDYETLQKETQQMELRVREFYRGTWVVPDRDMTGHEATVQDPVFPLVDSKAQQLIQKKIAVERLSACLRNVVGPLCLTMSDVSTDLNNLVRTFRFTNKNIIHKSPEWTLIAVVLLHVMSAVSPAVREALKTTASVEYLNTLMEELGLREQDLLNLVQLFKGTKH